jgi:hypothetical protein
MLTQNLGVGNWGGAGSLTRYVSGVNNFEVYSVSLLWVDAQTDLHLRKHGQVKMSVKTKFAKRNLGLAYMCVVV